MKCHGRLIHCIGLVTLTLLLLGCRGGDSRFRSNHSTAAAPDAVGNNEIAQVSWSQPVALSDDEAILPAMVMQQLDELPAPIDDHEPDDGELNNLELIDREPAAREPEEIPVPFQVSLEDVVASVQQTYPLVRTAILERQIASGQQLSAQSAFDLNVTAFGIGRPEGFYQTYRSGVSLTQPTFGGGYLMGGYRIGRGNFPAWYGYRETDAGGEFSLGYGVPLLKDRAIDARRGTLFQADLARQAVEPEIRAQVLEFMRFASHTYWTWVAAGRNLSAHEELLELAQARVEQIEALVEAGDLPHIALINNEQLIADRETRVIEAERNLQEAAIELSLFLRNSNGVPVIPSDSELPPEFPQHTPPAVDQLAEDIARALNARPELAALRLLAEQVRVELAQAENMLLPQVDAQVLASKDVGVPTPTGDKTPFELEAGLYGEVPLQRRNARGRIMATRGRLSQITAEQQFLSDRVTTQVQDAVSALSAAAGRIDRAQINLQLARQTLELGREQFDEGDIDLIQLNIHEQVATDAQLTLISAQRDYFVSLASYQTALAFDPTAPQD